MSLGFGIGIPNNNLVSTEDIPVEPGSLYELEESTFNYMLESLDGFYQTEQNYV
jgi:hypothetical protein